MIIWILAHICSCQVQIKYSQTQIEDTLQFNFQLSGLDTQNVDNDCIIQIRQQMDPIELIGYNGDIRLVTNVSIISSSQNLFFELMIGNCTRQPNINAIIQNILNYHLVTTYTLQVSILKQTQIVYSKNILIEGYSLYNSNIGLITSSFLNQAQANLTLSFVPITKVRSSTIFSIIFPYRDQYASNPISQYFKNGPIMCKCNQNLYTQCYFNNNNLTVQNVTDQIIENKQITLEFENFTNPQDINGVQGIKFQIFNQHQDIYYINEANDSISIIGFTQNSNLQAFIYNTSYTIETFNQLYIAIQVLDFYYQTTNIIINLPLIQLANQLLDIIPQNQLSKNISYSVQTGQIILKNCLIGYINNGYITFLINIKNPPLAKQYDEFNIMLQNDGTQQIITQTTNQILKVDPQNLVLDSIDTTNPKNGGTTDITISFKLNSTIHSQCILQVEWIADSQFSPKTQIQSLMEIGCSSVSIIDNLKIQAYNCFQQVNPDQNIQRQFMLMSITNPRFQKNNSEGDIQISTICDGYINNINQLPIKLPVIPSRITINNLENQYNQTNFLNNNIQISYQQENYLYVNDSIEISFNEKNFEISQLSLSVSCLINNQMTQCSNTANGIKLIVNQQLNPGQINTITIDNFISQVSVLNCVNIQITTFNSIYIIDQSQWQCISNIVQARNLNIFDLSIDDITLGALTNYIFLLQFSRNLNDGTIFIFFQGHHNLSQAYLIQNSKFSILNCYDSAIQINIQQQLFAGITYQIQILNIKNPLDSLYIQPIQVNVFSTDHSLKYQDIFDQQIQFKGLFYKNISIIQSNQLLNKTNNMTIIINPNIPLSPQYQLKVLISNNFTLLQNFSLFVNNQNQSVLYIVNTTENIILEGIFVSEIESQQVFINLINIINPKSDSIKYFVNVLTYNYEGTQIIEQGQQQISQLFCQDGCLNCSEFFTCNICNEGYYNFQGNCLKKCPDYTFQTNDQCLQCQVDNCLFCNTNTNKCSKCKEGYSNIQGNCENNVTAEQIQKVINQNKDYSNLLLVYFYIIQLILFMLYKYKHRRLQFFKTQIFIKGLMDNICIIISFSYYISDQMYGLAILILGFIFVRLIQQVNSQLYLLQYIKSDTGILKLQRQQVLKFILKISQFYDWKICYILESHINDRKQFNIEYENQLKIQTIQIDLLTKEINIITPGLLIFQITSISIWIDNISIFQISFLIYLALSQIVQIISLTQQKDKVEDDQFHKVDNENEIYI